MRFEQPLEFEQRLVVESDVIELRWREPGFGQTVVNCLLRKAGVVLLAAEAFFFGCGDDLAIDY